jgi:uncharacterized membrane protein
MVMELAVLPNLGVYIHLVRKLLQVLLGLTLCYTGILHLTSRRVEFQAQVPSWLPLEPDFVVIASGVVEIVLGLALLTLWKFRKQVGIATAIFFLLIFPGNVWQYLDGIDAFGLNTDTERGVRLLFQPVLVLWALWSTELIKRPKLVLNR